MSASPPALPRVVSGLARAPCLLPSTRPALCSADSFWKQSSRSWLLPPPPSGREVTRAPRSRGWDSPLHHCPALASLVASLFLNACRWGGGHMGYGKVEVIFGVPQVTP